MNDRARPALGRLTLARGGETALSPQRTRGLSTRAYPGESAKHFRPLLGLTRERVRQIELESLRRLAGLREMQMVAAS